MGKPGLQWGLARRPAWSGPHREARGSGTLLSLPYSTGGTPRHGLSVRPLCLICCPEAAPWTLGCLARAAVLGRPLCACVFVCSCGWPSPAPPSRGLQVARAVSLSALALPQTLLETATTFVFNSRGRLGAVRPRWRGAARLTGAMPGVLGHPELTRLVCLGGRLVGKPRRLWSPGRLSDAPGLQQTFRAGATRTGVLGGAPTWSSRESWRLGISTKTAQYREGRVPERPEPEAHAHGGECVSPSGRAGAQAANQRRVCPRCRVRSRQ